ncbi:hypothetical protein [Parasphingorhabdus sp.]|uniref:hypothetical protein n=1 Tax=Parasphingorhabdus sp. TaxID=2709688 RepID=UPI0039E21F28
MLGFPKAATLDDSNMICATIIDEAMNAIQLHHAPRANADRFHRTCSKKIERLGRSDAAKH